MIPGIERLYQALFGKGSKPALYPGNRERETARRRRQIAKGVLTESNGLERSL